MQPEGYPLPQLRCKVCWHVTRDPHVWGPLVQLWYGPLAHRPVQASFHPLAKIGVIPLSDGLYGKGD
jgi:hypothetical protein